MSRHAGTHACTYTHTHNCCQLQYWGNMRKGEMILDNFLVPMQRMGKFRLLSPEKASSHSTVLPRWVFSFFLCAVFSYFHTTGCEARSFTTDGYGIFNACLNFIYLGIEPRVFRFHFRLLTTELCPSSETGWLSW